MAICSVIIFLSRKIFVPLHPQKRGVAQLVAFLVWDQAVAGSSPVTSTEKDKPLILKELAVLFFVRFWGKKNPQPRLMEIADNDRTASLQIVTGSFFIYRIRYTICQCLPAYICDCRDQSFRHVRWCVCHAVCQYGSEGRWGRSWL